LGTLLIAGIVMVLWCLVQDASRSRSFVITLFFRRRSLFILHHIVTGSYHVIHYTILFSAEAFDILGRPLMPGATFLLSLNLNLLSHPPPPCFIQTANNTPYRPRNPSASSHALKLQPIPAMGELIYSYTIIRFFPLYIRRMGTSMACFLPAVQLAWH